MRFRFLLTLLAFSLMSIVVVAADGPFVEPDVSVIHAINGEQVGDGYGWVAGNLGDITGDGSMTSSPLRLSLWRMVSLLGELMSILEPMEAC